MCILSSFGSAEFAMDSSWQEDARRAVRMGLLLAERSINALLPEAAGGLPSSATAPPADPRVLHSASPAGLLPRPMRGPTRAPPPLEPGNPGNSPPSAGCGAENRYPPRVRPQRARISVVRQGALAGARDGRPSARARALPRPLPVLANLHRSRPARPRLASGAIGAAPHSSNRGPANKAQGVAGGPPPLRARAGSGPPPLPPRSPHPREGHGHARSRSARRTRDAMAAPSNPGLAPKMAARPPNGGPASRTTDTPKRPAPLTVFRSTSGTAAVPEGKTKQKRAKPGTSSDNPASPAAVQIAASPRLRLPAGLHIVGLPRRPNLSQLEALLSHVAGLSPSLAGLEPSFQLEQTRRSSRKIPAFFLSHAAFAIPGLVDRILEELLPAAGKDKRGRTKLASPIGTLKISPAQQSATTALPPPPDDRNGGLTPSNTASSCPDTEPHPSDGSGPAAFQGLRLVQFTAGDSEEGWTCVCCRGDILACDKLARLECLHVVHSDCLERWVKAPHSRGRCPECNAPVL